VLAADRPPLGVDHVLTNPESLEPGSMRQRSTILAAAAFALTGCMNEPVFYEAYRGANFESGGWRVAESRRAFAKLDPQTFDVYTKLEDGRGGLKVTRERSTPSGDWACYLHYIYAADGKLARIESELRTFSGFDRDGDAVLPTRCERSYTVSASGQIALDSEWITDLRSGQQVERTFWEPQIDHWMSVTDLPKPMGERPRSRSDRPQMQPRSGDHAARPSQPPSLP